MNRAALSVAGQKVLNILLMAASGALGTLLATNYPAYYQALCGGGLQ